MNKELKKKYKKVWNKLSVMDKAIVSDYICQLERDMEGAKG